MIQMITLIKEKLEGNGAETANLLAGIFQHIVDYHQSNPTIDFQTLVDGVMQFDGEEDAVLTTLNELLENDPENTVEYLFSHAAHHLTNVVHEESQDITRQIIKAVYDRSRSSEQDALIEGLSQQLNIPDHEAAEDRKRRTLLMHLLYQNVLITGEEASDALENHHFTHDTNQAILDKGFEHYNTYTQSVLAQNTIELTTEQQSKLLRLTDELKIITHKAEPDEIVPALEKEEEEGTLKTHLSGLLQSYKSQWKGSKREEQRLALQGGINDAFEDEDDDTTYNLISR